MALRFFVDENDLALGKALAEEHGDVVYPGHPALPDVPRGSLDDDWLQVIGRLCGTKDISVPVYPIEHSFGHTYGLVKEPFAANVLARSTAQSRYEEAVVDCVNRGLSAL